MAKKPIEEQIVTNWNDLVFEVERGSNRKFKWKITLGRTKHFGVLHDGEFVHALKTIAAEEVQGLLERSLKLAELAGQKVPVGMTISQIIVELNAFGVVRTGEFQLRPPELAPLEDSVKETAAESDDPVDENSSEGSYTRQQASQTHKLNVGGLSQIESTGDTEERRKKHGSKQGRSKRVSGFSPRR